MSKNFRETLNEQLKDPEFRAEWEALELKRQISRTITNACETRELTREQPEDPADGEVSRRQK